jgi:hypothetical protein
MNVIYLKHKMHCAEAAEKWLKTSSIGKYEIAYPYISFEDDEDATAFALMFPDREVPGLRVFTYCPYIPDIPLIKFR